MRHEVTGALGSTILPGLVPKLPPVHKVTFDLRISVLEWQTKSGKDVFSTIEFR